MTVKNHLAVKMENRETEVQIEPEDFARLEGEGGREVPIPELVDVPLNHAIWRRPRWAAPGERGQ